MEKIKKEKIKKYLLKNQKIIFTLFFGSTVSGGMHQLSDIDIGIYFKEKMDILELGEITAEL
ncbi:MAG: nucleotidyltransferase domain-containing protein, partial [Candidatus Marinimicrobia bacterium]|nr:nucleotidyltransferase domain-containing protein [Candidatus Neomarinimicrobiota bacterium]